MIVERITVKDFARHVGFAPSSIRNLLKKGELKGTKFGKTQVVDVCLLPKNLIEGFKPRRRGRRVKSYKDAKAPE